MKKRNRKRLCIDDMTQEEVNALLDGALRSGKTLNIGLDISPAPPKQKER